MSLGLNANGKVMGQMKTFKTFLFSGRGGVEENRILAHPANHYGYMLTCAVARGARINDSPSLVGPSCVSPSSVNRI